MMTNPFRVLADRLRRKIVPVSSGTTAPWWVDVLTDWGRPVVAAVVLAMCSPGEHYLAREAGFPKVKPLGMFYLDLAWGMPFVLTAYAGISAVVATKRPKRSPGKRTAVAGAILSILLAMAAQPVAHLYGYEGGWGYQQTLTVVVSCIPALVLGHLLHLAVSHVPERTSSVSVPSEDMPEDIREDVPKDKDTQWVFEDRTYRAGIPVSPVPPVSPVSLEDIVAARTGQKAGDVTVSLDVSSTVPPVSPMSPEDRDKAEDMLSKAFDVPKDILRVPGDMSPGRPAWLYDEDGIRPGHQDSSGDEFHYVPEDEPVSPPETGDSEPVPPKTEDELSSRRKLPELIRDIRRRVGDDPDTIKDGVLRTPGFEDMRSTPQKRNTLNTAVRRELKKTA